MTEVICVICDGCGIEIDRAIHTAYLYLQREPDYCYECKLAYADYNKKKTRNKQINKIWRL